MHSCSGPEKASNWADPCLGFARSEREASQMRLFVMIIMMDLGLKFRQIHQKDFKISVMQVYFHFKNSGLKSDHLGSNSISTTLRCWGSYLSALCPGSFICKWRYYWHLIHRIFTALTQRKSLQEHLVQAGHSNNRLLLELKLCILT